MVGTGRLWEALRDSRRLWDALGSFGGALGDFGKLWELWEAQGSVGRF